MDPFTLALMGGTALAGAGLNFLGSQNQASASREASQQQTMMQGLALQNQMRQQAQLQENIAPYLQTGSGAANMLTQNLPFLTSPIRMDQATLEQTPGYQFNLTQGLKAAQNSAAARGLGVSGAAFKGAENYATGLADSTYQNQFNMENTNRTNAYNRLFGTAVLGANAAGGLNTANQNNVNAQSNIFGNIGTAGAQGILGSAAAQNAGLSSIGGGLNNLTSMYYLFGRGGGGGGGAGGGGMYPAAGDLGMAGPGFGTAAPYAPSLGYYG